MNLVQLSRHTGNKRLPYLQKPDFLELPLEWNQRVVQLEWKCLTRPDSDRKTNDWTWTAWIETRL